MNQGLLCGCFSTAAAAAAAGGQATRCPLLFISAKCRAPPPLALEVIKPGAPFVHSAVITLHPPRRIKKSISPVTITKSNQIGAVVAQAEENTSWRGDKRGVRAGGDPSGSRRSISIQNHAYDFSQRHTLRVDLPEDSAQYAAEWCNFS